MPLAAFLARIALIVGAISFAAAGCGFPHFEFPVGDKLDASAEASAPLPDASPEASPEATPDAGPDVRACSSATDCLGSTSGSICDVDAGRCVQCIPGQNDCPWGLVCDANGKCSSGCFSTQDCTPPDAGTSGAATGAADAGAPLPLTCAPSNKCWGCAADSDCPPSSYCEPQSKLCLPGCTAFHACAVGYLCCDGTCIGGSESCGGCPGGFADCNKMPGDGCETPLNTLDNCGGCGTKCQFAHQATNCDTGSCVIGACIEPYANCDMWQSTGCEVDKSNDRMNCGGCGNVCQNPHGSTGCTDGACKPVCDPGWSMCDPMAGCTVDLTNDPLNCGRCGHVCKGGNCINGNCECADIEPVWDVPGGLSCSGAWTCGPYSGTPDQACKCFCVNQQVRCRINTSDGPTC